MYPAATPMVPDTRPPAATAAFWLAIVVAAVWAMSNATLCHALYESSLQSPGHLATAIPMPGNDWTTLAVAMAWIALPLSPGPVIVLVAGLRYLRSVALTGWLWLTLWAVAVVAAVTAEALLLYAVVALFRGHGQSAGRLSAHIYGGPKELALWFVAAGIAMLGVMIIAAKTVSGGARNQAGSR